MNSSIQRLTIWLGILGLSAACRAQNWEVGGVAGAGFARSVTVSTSAGSASAGFGRGLALGAYLGHNPHKRIGGEIRYLYRAGGPRLTGAGSQASFKGDAHLVTYEVLVHARSKRSHLRPFLAFGAGARMTRGTGLETAYQPLWGYALLTKARQIQPVAGLGAGIKIRLSSRLLVRADVHDYISPFPTQVIAPAAGARLGGWLHDLVPTIGVAAAF
jgi:hypothetical protein